MRPSGLTLTALLLATAPAGADPVAIANADFETDPLADGQIAVNVAPSGWTLVQEGSTLAGQGDPTTAALADQEGDVNNVAWVFQDNFSTGQSFFLQTLAATLAPSTRYTLTLRVADTMAGSVTPPEQGRAFPAIGDGVSTGEVFAALHVDGGLVRLSFPGFVSSDLPAPADGGWATWTLVWETGADEPLAGTPIGVSLGARGADVDEEREVFFDDVALDAMPVPEPGAALGGALAVALLARCACSLGVARGAPIRAACGRRTPLPSAS